MVLSPSLKTPLQAADFIASVQEFLPASDRAPYERLVRAVTSGKPVSESPLFESARTAGILTWPMRHALDRFLATAGSDEEWDALLSSVRPKTAAVLTRLRKAMPRKTLDEALASSDASTIINEDAETEIVAERSRARLALWKSHAKKLAPLIVRANGELKAMQRRLTKIHDQASRSRHEQDLLLAKVAGYEDRVYFRGETIPLDVLDAEIAFDVEENELPAEG